MADENLTADERAAVLKLVRDTIAADRYPMSPRVMALKSALSKLDPETAPHPAVAPLPRPRLWTNSSLGQRKRRR
jgi:hypothetical protein